MGLSGKLSVEMEIKSSANKYFHGWIDHGALFSKAIPDDVHKSEVHEGDGKSLGSINSYCYVLDGDKVVSTKAKMEAIDEENKSMTLNAFDGHVGELYRNYKLHVQAFTKDEKNFVKCIIEYEKLSEAVPEPINYLELTTKLAKGLDTHLLQA
ncbi:MLP-like protein 43 isoform X2 [Telopea speciosissima]|uniref:MLP-like protein 43 isoform X2 n=1 Tax=Telopea speciosissima TaxID=54955 RepID=UPI001CC65552|nr:MLP-like protein 43 isoform X2 [Telopea speciosissima]XP_043695145.1 MLP-like protein 43 isoform X2 [Telopea speciosissima]